MCVRVCVRVCVPLTPLPLGKDYGATFSQFASPTALPNPDAGIDGTIMNGVPGIPMILMYNHNKSARNPLSLAVSKVRTSDGCTEDGV